MAKLNSLFQRFLSNIEPDPEALSYAQEAHQPVREALAKDEKFEHMWKAPSCMAPTSGTQQLETSRM